jgi:hypothetical protein
MTSFILMWGRSSGGRALGSHSRGREFDSPRLHQNYRSLINYQERFFFYYILDYISNNHFLKDYLLELLIGVL